MRKTLLTTAALLIGASLTPAIAGGLNEPTPEPAPTPMPAPAPVAMGGNWTGFYAGGSLGYADVTGSNTLGDDIDGLTYGVHAGYGYDLGGVILGGEIELSGFDVTDESVSPNLDVDSVLRLKARVGYDAGDFQPYLVAGGAQLTTSGFIDDSDTGYFYGIGGDYRLGGGNIRLGAELLQHEFEDYAGSGVDVSANTLGLRASFDF